MPASGVTLTDNSTGITKIQDCDFYSHFGGHTKVFFVAMSEIEASSNCAGICYRSNVGITSDSTNANIQTNFNSGGASCFDAFLTFALDLWLKGVIYFGIMLFMAIIAVIVSTCFLCHLHRSKKRIFK